MSQLCKFSPVVVDRDGLLVHPCDRSPTQTIKSPGYVVKINNLLDPNDGGLGSCILRDDNEILLEDDDDSTICMDQI